MAVARLIIADTEKHANLYYATRFLAPDPFIFAQVDGRGMIVMSDLEVDRAKAQARVDEVLSYAALSRQANGDRGCIDRTNNKSPQESSQDCAGTTEDGRPAQEDRR